MLPVGSFRIVHAQELKPGDFALLHILENAPAIVVKHNEYTVAVLLEGDLNRSHTFAVEEISGYATVIDDWEIEIDHRVVENLDHMNNRPGSLVLRGNALSIAITPPSHAGYVVLPICDLPSKSSGTAFGFSKWRIVRRVEDREIVLFERTT